MTAALPWFRLYTEFAGDPKIQVLAFEDQRHYVVILCLKGNGTLDAVAPSDAYRERVIAKGLGLDTSAACEAKRRLVEAGLIGHNWQPVKWDTRQFKSDHDAADRKRRQRARDRKKAGKKKPRTLAQPVTTASRDSHASESDAETETEQRNNLEGARTERAAPVPGLDAKAWARWIEYRQAIRKPIRPVSVPAAQRALAKHGPDQAAVVEQSIANSWQGLFALKDHAKGGAQPPGGRPDEAAWAEARARAAAIGFRDPWPQESAPGYMTQVKLAEDARPRRRAPSGVELAAKFRVNA